ncbi:MAG: RHS repeat-associated core domain-containing protein, partial [Methanomicrobiales archaeon]|nr:RHS repeat-associated core domain-containing protein [Methanomicrobiales archaeon]
AYKCDNAGRMVSLINSAPNGSVISQYLYQYDNNGNPTAITSSEGITRYGYDSLNQLTNVTYPDGTTESFFYDSVGNRVQIYENGVAINYATNAMNQYTSVGGQSFTYDANGNLISKTEAGKTTTYEYRADNRITKVITPDDTWEYRYDPLGNRNQVVHNGVTESYLIDPLELGNVVSSTSGNQTTHYRYGLGLLSQVNSAGIEYQYLFDQTGHTSEIIDGSGNLQNQYRYTAFGEYRVKKEAISNPFTYVGQYGVIDEGTGLFNMRMRDYNPEIGRFNSEDPVIFLQDSRYSYCRNNPVIFIDPYGMDSESLIIGSLYNSYNRKAKETGKTVGENVKKTFKNTDTKRLLNNCYTGHKYSQPQFAQNVWVLVEKFDRNEEFSNEDVLIIETCKMMYPSNNNDEKINGIHIGSNNLCHNCLFSQQSSSNSGCGHSVTPVGPRDPEDKFGPSGFDHPNTPESNLHRYIPGSVQTLPYRVDIWNAANATLNVRDIDVYDEITQNLDRNSFGFTEVGFMDWTVPLDGAPSFLVYVDTRPSMNLTVKIEGMYNPTTGMVNLTYNTLDPVTLLPPEDPLIGFLPPISDSGKEITWFAYTTKTKPDLPTGTRIENRAWVQFDGFGAYNPAPP